MNAKRTIISLLAMVALNLGFGQDTAEFFSKADAFFKAHVKSGKVDYDAIKASPSNLYSLLDLARTISVSNKDSRTYQAFWINTYNLSVIKGVVDKYPIKSPLDINGFFDTETYVAGGKNVTLNTMENNLLRANFPKEARFHFVLVCAGLGCPPIIDRAYLPETLEVQLQEQTILALNDPSFVRIKGKRVYLSQIFEWYREDFTQNGKSLLEFVNQYRKEKITDNVKIGYYPYDWSLNETK